MYLKFLYSTNCLQRYYMYLANWGWNENIKNVCECFKWHFNYSIGQTTNEKNTTVKLLNKIKHVDHCYNTTFNLVKLTFVSF